MKFQGFTNFFFGICCLLFLLISSSLSAQMTDEDLAELYPEEYTFEKADEFVKDGELESAIWFYINLFPENKMRVVETVKALEEQLDTVDMRKLVKSSFTLNAMFDPEINAFENGESNLQMEELKLKGAWGDELIQKLSPPDTPLANASEYNFRGLDKVNAGDIEGGILDFDEALELESNGQVYFNRAYAKSMINNYEAAILDYNETIKLEYRLAESYFERGYCLDNLSDTSAAILDYSEAIRLEENYASAYNNRATIRLKNKDFARALEDFGKAIQANPNFAAAYVNRGFTHLDSGNKTAACEDWKRALALGFMQAEDILATYYCSE